MKDEHTSALAINEDMIIAVLREIYDPEIPVNIYDMGLIYKITIFPTCEVAIEMTLTTPGCPVAQTFPGVVENEVKKLEGVVDCTVELVWDPPWTVDRMSEAAKLELGWL